jgi:hypothetical protein
VTLDLSLKDRPREADESPYNNDSFSKNSGMPVIRKAIAAPHRQALN